MICKQCNHCRDIDLCKDPHQSQLSDVDKTPVWVCASANCGAAYDTAEIEHQLVDALQRKSMGFTLQDLQVGSLSLYYTTVSGDDQSITALYE